MEIESFSGVLITCKVTCISFRGCAETSMIRRRVLQRIDSSWRSRTPCSRQSESMIVKERSSHTANPCSRSDYHIDSCFFWELVPSLYLDGAVDSSQHRKSMSRVSCRPVSTLKREQARPCQHRRRQHERGTIWQKLYSVLNFSARTAAESPVTIGPAQGGR